jgi:hypothetical protein
MQETEPTRNPADTGDPYAIMKFFLAKALKQTDSMLPGIVRSFDGSKNPPRAQVQPSINLVLNDSKSTQLERAPLLDVPVLLYGNAKFCINAPLKSGDTGLLIAADRDISNFLQSPEPNRPISNRFKNFSDSFFLPFCSSPTTEAVSDGISIQNANGTTAIILTDDSVSIKIGGVIVFSMNTSDMMINVTNRVVVKQNLAVELNITAGGTITPGVPP